MGESKFSGKAVVEDNIGDAADGAMSGKSDNGNRKIVLDCGVNGNAKLRPRPRSIWLYSSIRFLRCHGEQWNRSSPLPSNDRRCRS